MSLAVLYSRARLGMEAPLVTIEVHLTNGLPGFTMVGLPETAVKEARDRVRSALLNSQFEFPDRRITVNMAPADLPKQGAQFDLAIALGILIASKQLAGDGIDGFATEYAVRPATAFTRAPKGFSHVEAATITTAGLTAWRALVELGNLKAGDTVLALGTGGVSIYALQIARAMGARVAITSSSAEKLARARELGADFTLNYNTHQDWGKQVMDWTGGRGVDHVVEVGGPGTLAQSIQAVALGGRITMIGVLTGVSGEVPTAALMAKQVVLSGIIVGSRRHQQDFVRAFDTGIFRPVIDRVFPLEELADAFRYEESGAHFGKIGIE